MERSVLLALLVGAIVFADVTQPLAGSVKPVSVGGEAEYDACGGSGVIAGLDPQGDNFLAVRAGPGSGYAILDRVHNGQPYFDCDGQGGWVGIVYSDDPKIDCGVSTPIAKRQPYNGPCKSGWVSRKYTRHMAG